MYCLQLKSEPSILSPLSSDHPNTPTVSTNSSEEQLVQAASRGLLLRNPAHLVDFVVTTLFESLVGTVYSNPQKLQQSVKSQLSVWFKTYR